MPKIYAQLPCKDPKAFTVDYATGQELLRDLQKGFDDELKDKRLTSISFEGYEHGELDDSFYAKYSSADQPLQVTYLNSVKNLHSSAQNDATFIPEGYMVELAKKLKVSLKIYVRECYDMIWRQFIEYEQRQKKLQINHPERIAHAFLTGTPGIGKTTFLLYLIDLLLKDQRQVIFGSGNFLTKFVYWKSRHDYELIEEGDIDPYVSNPDIFFLMDSRDIQSTLGPCIICSSPRADIAKQFRKTAKLLYMPVWDWNEIQQLHVIIYSDLISKDYLATRFFFIGGVPRYLFERTDENGAEFVKFAINQSEPSHLMRLYQSQGSFAPEKVSHRLIHQDGITEYSLKYASPFVTTLVAEKFQTIRPDMVIQWLDETSELGKAGGLRGHLFEDIGHAILRKGGCFCIRNLDSRDGNTEMKTIPARDLTIVGGGIHTLRLSNWIDQYYYKPVSKIFECIDSWMVMDGETWGFKFTVAPSHKISTSVYWLFENFNLRHHVTVVYDQHFPEPEEFNLKQYVMMVDGNLTVDLSEMRNIAKSEFLQFVQQPWTDDTQREFELAFEE
ncbi:hypothetical protein MP228_000608 [Amoeboaphelidium protococcarum]|nr:hypothetical protein MP228_000608 [Amoeboaphelidium protococcarum]